MAIRALSVFMTLVTINLAAVQDDFRPATLELTGTLPVELSEASGIAASRQHPGVFWLHNDSGSDALIYATDSTGRILARFRVTGAGARDWEDIALGPCLFPGDGASCLYIADTGDNQAVRASTSIYVIPEPDPTQATRSTEPARRIRIRLWSGPTDIEALAVSPTGEILLVSKGRDGRVQLFRFPSRTARVAVESQTPLELRAAGTLNLGTRPSFARQVTGAAINPSGTTLVVRTYRTLFFYLISDDTLQVRPPHCRIGAAEPQGEAVDFLDDRRLILASERLTGYPGTIYITSCT